MAGRLEFEAWYRAERPDLVRALWAISGDRDVAVDVVDEAFSRALARWDQVSSMRSPGGWVRTVALNLHRRLQRRRGLEERLLRRRHMPVVPEPEVPDPQVWAAVASLPTRQREVIVLRYVADLSEADTATALGISEGAASASLTKARRHLAQVLEEATEVSQL